MLLRHVCGTVCRLNLIPRVFFPKEMGRAGKRPGPFCRPSHFLREKSLGMRLVVASEILNPERLKKIKGNRQTWTSRLQFRLYFILFFLPQRRVHTQKFSEVKPCLAELVSGWAIATYTTLCQKRGTKN